MPGAREEEQDHHLGSLFQHQTLRTHFAYKDEATSSVDVETDAKLQHTIRTELSSSTLLCIAHRLNTIGMLALARHLPGLILREAHYDRVLVMDRGKAAEFDNPLALFDRKGSIFRSLCNEASLTRDDIVRIRSLAQGTGAGAST